jgi:hypothetical protein
MVRAFCRLFTACWQSTVSSRLASGSLSQSEKFSEACVSLVGMRVANGGTPSAGTRKRCKPDIRIAESRRAIGAPWVGTAVSRHARSIAAHARMPLGPGYGLTAYPSRISRNAQSGSSIPIAVGRWMAVA